ncbi:MAG: type 1 glutamine amidotransferase [Gammaproteobacteria bacterium]
MKSLLIFRHIDIEGPGFLSNFLDEHKIDYRIIKVDQGDSVPTNIDDASGIVLLGGPMSVNDSLPWIDEIEALITHAVKKQIPLLGHCLGAQLIAKALGADVQANAKKEIGWFDVHYVNNQELNTDSKIFPAIFKAFHWHGETFSLPAGATPLYENQTCVNQAFLMGNILALQFHLEVTAEMVESWTNVYDKELSNPNALNSIQSRDEILSDISNKIIALNEISAIFYRYWINLL